MSFPARSLASLLLVLFALAFAAGCGSDDDEEGSGGDGGGASTSQVGEEQGSSYSLDLPSGWREAKDEAQKAVEAINFDSFYAKERRDGFATNVNVIRERVPEGTGLESLEPTYNRQLRGSGATDISEPRDRELDGEPAVVRDYSIAAEGRKLAGQQLATLHDGRLYTVTFTARRDAFDADQPEFEEILDSWRWD